MITEAYQMSCAVGVPQHLICVGDSGTGKSTLKQQMEKDYPSFEENGKK